MFLSFGRRVLRGAYLGGVVMWALLSSGCQQQDPRLLIHAGKSGYLCRIQIGGDQPIGQAIAIYQQRLRQAGASQVEIKPLKGRKIQVEVKKIRLSSALSILLQAQGNFGLHRFVEDHEPLWSAYQKLSSSDQKALLLGPSMMLRTLLAKASSTPSTTTPTPSTTSAPSIATSAPTTTTAAPTTTTSASPTTRPQLSVRPPASLPTPSLLPSSKHAATRPAAVGTKAQPSAAPTQKRKRSALDIAEIKQLRGAGHHLFFGSSRARMEQALNGLVLPIAWRNRVRFLWKRSLSQRFWLVYLVHHPAPVSRMHLGNASLVVADAAVGSMGTQLSLSLMPDGTKALTDLSIAAYKKPLAIALDDLLYAEPIVQSPISTGNLLLAPSYDLLPDERLRFLRAWAILLSLPPLEASPSILYVRRLQAF